MGKKLIAGGKRLVKAVKGKGIILIRRITYAITDDSNERLDKLIKLLVPVQHKGS